MISDVVKHIFLRQSHLFLKAASVNDRWEKVSKPYTFFANLRSTGYKLFSVEVS